MPNTLFLRLEGALQAWGERGRWSIRDSAPEPTKSGVIGLLGCALGLSADEPLRTLSRQTRLGVRCDEPGVRLTDYHTIGGGYPLPALLTAEGKPKAGGGGPHTEVSKRDYLCGASFLVAVQADDPALINRLAHAVQNPVWPIYLGRKSCIPSRPVYDGVGDFLSLEDALRAGRPSQAYPVAANVRTVIECDTTRGETGVRRRDALVSRRFRTYEPRYTRDGLLSLGSAAIGEDGLESNT